MSLNPKTKAVALYSSYPFHSNSYKALDGAGIDSTDNAI